MNLATQMLTPARPAEAKDDRAAFELHFGSLFVVGRGLSFPCDACGRVEESRLSQRARVNYRHALAVIGREYGMPSVRRSDLC